MSEVAQNIKELQTHIPPHVKIVAVSKTKTVEAIREAMQAGQHLFGENKVQELTEKYEQIPEAQWHFIGHLQTNKVKYMASFVQMIHSVDSFRVLEEINKQAAKYRRVIDCLLQIHIAREETKFGLSEQEALQLLDIPALQNLEHIRICGLMGIASYTEDTNSIRNEFQRLANFHKRIKRDYFSTTDFFHELSMGMSNDYRIAIEEGSTMVRIGSLIFGERVYNEEE